MHLHIGRPIDVSAYYGRDRDRRVLDLLTKRLLKEIARLAGEPDFEPELAGKNYAPDSEPTS